MREKFPDVLEKGRVTTGRLDSEPGDRFGAFYLVRNGVLLLAIAGDGGRLDRGRPSPSPSGST